MVPLRFSVQDNLFAIIRNEALPTLTKQNWISDKVLLPTLQYISDLEMLEGFLSYNEDHQRQL